jgi:hypothetical protein
MSARIAIAGAAVAALALAAGSPAAPPTPAPGQITAGTGCAAQCVVKALVTPTASYANVAIETSVPTKIQVLAFRAAGSGADATFHSSTLATQRSVFLPGLKPDTTYQIFVKATDAQGRSDSRQGSFTTRKVASAVETGIGKIKSNVGCSIQCVRKALFTHVGGTDATIDVETAEPAKLQVMLSPDAPIQESWGPRFSFIERSVSSQGLVTKWTGQLGQLRPGTKYNVIVSATDAQGQSAYQTGTLRMDDRKVRITLLKITVISDADKGSANEGEIKFDHWIGDHVFGHAHFRRIGSGATINVEGSSGRPGVLAVLVANGTDPEFEMGTLGAECDWQQLRYCVLESGWSPHTGGGEIGGGIGRRGGDYATAGGTFHLNSLLDSGGLSSTYGMDLPAGHDAYFAYQTTSHYLQFRVYGYLDVFYE